MASLMSANYAKQYFQARFPGFKWVKLVATEDHVVHCFDDRKLGQRMLIEVLPDNVWAAYTLHESGEGTKL